MEEKKYREVLIFVAGTTPQIITETLYGLILNKKQPVWPEEICVLTTEGGKRKIEEELIGKGRLIAFQEEFGLPPIPFNEESIIVLTDSNGRPLQDIRGAEQNEAVGDLIADFIRKKAGDPASRLHCSLAGGRKTMSFYLGSALQLFGRPWDKLYHVLVSPEFESLPDFYYRPRKNRAVTLKDSRGKVLRKLNTREAEISPAEIPFLSLTGKLSLNGKSYRALIAESQREINAATVQHLFPSAVTLSQFRRREVLNSSEALWINPFNLSDEVKVAIGGNDFFDSVIDHRGGMDGVPGSD